MRVIWRWTIIIFNEEDREYFVTLSPFASLRVNSPKGLSRWAERCFAALSMTVPKYFVTLSAAKGLARWAKRCFAALILRFAQDDSTVLVVKLHHRLWPR